MIIKRTQLKETIKQVVRESLAEREYQQLLKEVSPPGKKSERQIQHVKSSLRDSHPKWSEDKITSVAIATAWKHHNKADEQVGADVVAEGIRRLTSSKKLREGLAVIVKEMVNKKLREAAYKIVSPNSVDTAKEDKARTIQTDPEVNEASYKQVSPNETDTAKEDKARKIQTEPKVTENHKVQHRSYKTSDDMDNKPENVRDPEVPMS